MEPFLAAAERGNIDELNHLIGSNRLVLKEMALKAAGHTPLHVACVAGNSNLVRQILTSMPEFAKKKNADGFSPLHIAAAGGDVEIARELLKVGPQSHLCSVKGREGRIPLHYAIINGELEVMRELLTALPESVEETTAQKESALDLAVKNNRFDAVVELVKHLTKHNKEQVINWKDNKGDTVLHLAVADKNFEVVDFMLCRYALEHEVVDVNALNQRNSTPLDVLTLLQRGAGDTEIREILTRAGGISASPASSVVLEVDQSGENVPQSLPRFTSRNLNRENESKGDMRNALLVVAALIANATYQTVLQPPQFAANDEEASTKGLVASYILFISGNTFGLLVSVQMIICLTGDLPARLPMLLSLTAMVQTYYCYAYYLPIKLLGEGFGMKRVEVLCVVPLTAPILLLLIQRRLALALDSYLKGLSRLDLLGNMYRL